MTHTKSKQLTDAFFDRLIDQQAAATSEQALYRRQAQIFCGRWLALRRLTLGYPLERLAATTGLDAQTIVFLEAGLADASLAAAPAWQSYCRQLAAVRNDVDWLWMVLAHALGRLHAPSERVMMRVVADLNAVYRAQRPRERPAAWADAPSGPATALAPSALILRWIDKSLRAVRASVAGPIALTVRDPAAATVLTLAHIDARALSGAETPQSLGAAEQDASAALEQTMRYLAIGDTATIHNLAPRRARPAQPDRPIAALKQLHGYLEQLGASVPLADVYVSLCTDGPTAALREFARPSRARAVDPGAPPAPAIAATITLTTAELVEQAVARSPRLLLLGAPGSGKSTVLRHLAAQLGQRCIDPGAPLPHGWETPRLPILCSLEQLTDSIGTRLPRNGSDLLHALLRYVPAGDRGDATRQALRQALLGGQALLLLDGLEALPTIAGPDGRNPRATILAAIQSLARTLPQQTRIVVTCSSYAHARPWLEADQQWSAPAAEGWHTRTLQPLTLDQTQLVARRWFQRRGTPAAQPAGLLDQLAHDRDLRRTSSSPLALTLLLTLFGRGDAFDIPHNCAQLYERFVAHTLAHEPAAEAAAHAVPWGAPAVRRAALQNAAFAWWSSRDLRAHEPAQLDDSQLHELRRIFPHTTSQAFLAACHLATAPKFELRAYALWRGDAAEHWRAPLVMMAGRLHQLGAAERQLLPWLGRLLHAIDPDERPKPDRQLQLDTLLAADSYRECGGRAGMAGVAEAALDDFERRLVARLAEVLAAWPLATDAERLSAGWHLGALGDARPGVVGPAPNWCVVPAAPTSPSFKIARYPVTNAQWRAFMDDGGYTAAEWWGEDWGMRAASGWSQPVFWGDADFNQPNQPVVGISWYEARAFCAWLSARGRAEGWIGAGEQLRPPTAQEWARAAQGDDQRSYPWGNQWHANHANTVAAQLGQPAPVGCYPHGASPCGALDMSGNVAEWCSLGVGGQGERYARCGGSWAEDAYQARCDATQATPPDTRGNLLGLRLVLAKLDE